MSEKCVIPPNDDVLGIGIRINFYATMVFLSVIPRTPHTEELLNVLYANTGIAGLGLLVTAIQQTAKQKLSFFHAIFVQHILFFLGIGAAPSGKYNWTRSRLAIGILIQFASVIAFTVWALYLWIRAKDFGLQPICNIDQMKYDNDQVKYVLMFVTVRATASWLRGLWIATLVVSALGLMTIFGVKGFAHYAMRTDEEEKTKESEEGWYFFISFSQIFTAIYSIVMLELAVQRNSTSNGGVVSVTDDNTEWAFGQILSVVMIFANINEVVHCLFGYYTRRRKRSHECQAEEAQQASNDTDVRPTSSPYRPRGLPGSHLSARDASQMKLSSELELLNLKEDALVSEITVVENSQIRDQAVGTIR